MEIEYIHIDNFEKTSSIPNRTLLVAYDDDQFDFKLAPAKLGDVGMDLPVLIKREGSNELKKPLVYPDHYKHFIKPNGTDEDRKPWLEVPAVGWAEIPCGLRIKVPEDAWGNIKSRSSTLWKKHLMVAESVIDSGFVGQIFILVFNPNNYPIRVHQGDRLAQLIIIPKYPLEKIYVVNELPDTERGETCFGSTGNIHKAYQNIDINVNDITQSK